MRRASVIVGLGLAALAGCGAAETDGYDPALRYSARTDPIVLRLPSAEPPGLPPPGKLDTSILSLRSVGGELVLPLDLSPSERDPVTRTVDDLFGTPAAPSATGPVDAGGFDLSPPSLAAGSRIYGRLCANCHGLNGDGRGPVGPWSYPYPRDFRTGVFKLAIGDSKPTAEQMIALLRHGVPGSAMPVYDLLSDTDIRAVAAIVVHQSQRGEAEIAGLRAAADGDDPSVVIRTTAATLGQRWSQSRPTVPSVVGLEHGTGGYDDAVRRGKDLFHSPTTGCVTCHRDYGRVESYRYDVWGAPVRVPDLTQGLFRWGRDDATLAARIRYGIPAVGMPASPSLTDAQLVDLVTFIRDLGAPARLPTSVRAEIYPQATSR